MKKRMRFINGIAIAFLIALLVISSCKCIRVTEYGSLLYVIDGLTEPTVQYKSLRSIPVIILIFLQVVFWFFHKKSVRTIGAVLSSMTMLLYICVLPSMNLLNDLTEMCGFSVIVYEFLPLGYATVIVSIIIEILTVGSLIELKKHGEKEAE
jgi:uncharacterized RDD family membrane protein YckC